MLLKRSAPSLLLLAALAGCSRSEPEPEANLAVEEPAGPATAEPALRSEPPPSPEPSAEANAADAELPPAEEVGADEQMLDDASTTGMTARVRRGEEDLATEGATEPLPANSEE